MRYTREFLIEWLREHATEDPLIDAACRQPANITNLGAFAPVCGSSRRGWILQLATRAGTRWAGITANAMGEELRWHRVLTPNWLDWIGSEVDAEINAGDIPKACAAWKKQAEMVRDGGPDADRESDPVHSEADWDPYLQDTPEPMDQEA